MTGRRGTHAQLGRLPAALAGPAVAVVLILVGAAPASAHANLVRAEPADSATVTTAPPTVTLVFDENVRAPSVIVVTDPTGTPVEQGTVAVLDDTATIRVRVTEAGLYTVAFRVLSADGHPVADQTTFVYRPSGAGSSSPAASTGSRAGRGWVVGAVAVAALVGGVGLLTVRRRKPRSP